jgi:plastocyanin
MFRASAPMRGGREGIGGHSRSPWKGAFKLKHVTSRRLRRGRRTLAVTLGAMAALASTSHAAPAEVAVGSGGDRFTPKDVTVTAGEAVTWRWSDSGHNVQVDAAAEQFDSGYKSSGGTFAHTFTTPGTYEFYCDPHRGDGMRGTVTVTPASTPPPPPPGGGGTGGGSTGGGATGGGSTGGGTTGGGTTGTGSATASSAGADATAPLVRLVRSTFRGRSLRLNVRLSEASAIHVGMRRRGSSKAITKKFAGRKGANALRISTRGMRRGRYRLRVVAVDVAGNRSRARTRTLVVRR